MAPATPAEARGRLLQHRQRVQRSVAAGPRPDLHRRTGQSARSGDADRADRVRHLRRSGMPVSGNDASGAGALCEDPRRRDALDRLRRQRRDRLCHHRQRHDAVRGPGDRLEHRRPVHSARWRAARCMPRATTDAVLWVVTNEPQLAFENLRAPARGAAPTELVHYRADRNRAADRSDLRGGPQRRDRRLRADLLRRTAGSHAQHPADADRGDELAARRRGAASASAQLGGGVADHQGRSLLLGHRRQAQGLGALGDHDHAARRRCIRITTAATSRRCS